MQKQTKRRSSFSVMYIVLTVFLLMAAVLFAERLGIIYVNRQDRNSLLPREQVLTCAQAVAPLSPDCLVLTDLGREDSLQAFQTYQQIFLDLKVPYETVDLGDASVPSDFSAYSTLVILTPDMSAIGDALPSLFDWVKNGGRILFGMTLDSDYYSSYVLQKAGVLYCADDRVRADRIYVEPSFMIGGGQYYNISDAFDSAMGVQLRDDVPVYLWSGDRGGTPLIWSQSYGKGNIVMYNLGYYDIAFRGFCSSAYSLLEDVSVFPVLNGAAIFLDDMPSPVPEGVSDYITRDYHVSISEFYSNYWFRDIQTLSERFGFPLIGLVVENYEDDTSGYVSRQQDTSRFSYFGNLILRGGGELGYHGYNHQPLCLDDVDYRDLFQYHTWPDTATIDTAFSELRDFCDQLYPTTVFTLYVPPSNILSPQGREYLSGLYPTVRTISGSYLPEDKNEFVYEQEFGVAEDGIIEFPRITSGSVLDDYMRLVALSELNFHMVFSHFIHPDDAMDVDRGAERGWPALYQNMTGFFQWLVDAVPCIRRVDSETMAGTIQRWSGLTVQKEQIGQDMHIHLGNYVDEAYLLLRFNNGSPAATQGGTLTQLTDTLYLLQADRADIVLTLKEAQE